MDFLLTPVITILVACLGFFLKEQWAQIKGCKIQINELKQELMKRSEIIAHVDKEINKLKLELKEDYSQVLDAVNRLDGKLDQLIQIMISDRE